MKSPHTLAALAITSLGAQAATIIFSENFGSLTASVSLSGQGGWGGPTGPKVMAEPGSFGFSGKIANYSGSDAQEDHPLSVLNCPINCGKHIGNFNDRIQQCTLRLNELGMGLSDNTNMVLRMHGLKSGATWPASGGMVGKLLALCGLAGGRLVCGQKQTGTGGDRLSIRDQIAAALESGENDEAKSALVKTLATKWLEEGNDPFFKAVKAGRANAIRDWLGASLRKA